MQKRKTVMKLFLSLALVISMLTQTVYTSAAGTVATNGNQKIQVTIKVTNKANEVVVGADVTLKAHDFNIFAKTRDLSLTATTDNNGVATFKISSTYDRVKGYSVSKKGYKSVEKSLDDFIGLTKTKRSYTVTANKLIFAVNFYDAKGNVICNQKVEYGEGAEAPETPEYNGELKRNMVFTGWDKEFSSVTERLEVHPLYTSKVVERYYHLFMNAPAEVGGHIAITNDGMRFLDPFAFVDIEENENGVVEFGDGSATRIEDCFDVAKSEKKLFINQWQPGKYLEKEETGTKICVKKGGEIYKTNYNTIDWYKVSHKNNQIWGKSNSWDKYYVVKFYDATGAVISEQEILPGEAAVAPKAPEYVGDSDYYMVFAGWDKSFEQVTEPMDIYPTYQKGTKKAQILFYVYLPDGFSKKWVPVTNDGIWFGDVFAQRDVAEGEDGYVTMSDGEKIRIEDCADIKKAKLCVNGYQKGKYLEYDENGEPYICARKSEDAKEVYKAKIYDADWCEINRKDFNKAVGKVKWKFYYTVDFYDAEGNVIKTQDVLPGEAAVAPKAPEYVGDSDYAMEFAGWDVAFDNVQSALAVHPVFKKAELKGSAVFYIDLPNGEQLRIGNSSVSFYNSFAMGKKFVEEDGCIHMSDGEMFTLESLCPVLEEYVPYCTQYVSATVENGDTIIYTDKKTGKKYCASFDAVDWYEYNTNNTHLRGRVTWEEVVEMVETTAYPEER